MIRPSLLHGALLAALLAAPVASRAATAPARPTPGTFTSPKLRGWINDVPDTGQFLADTVWVLRVGPRVSTVGDFVAGWFASYPVDRPGQDSLGRVQFLKNMMNRDILGLTAQALDRPLGFEDRVALRETRQRALADAVYRRFVRDSVTVSDDEVRSLWETFKWAGHFRHILVADRNAAERVRRDIVSGRIAWSAAVKKYSISKNDRG